MLILVVETVTGGGLAGKPLPTSLIGEGALMRDSLIGDLEDLPGVRVVTTHDARLPPPPRGTSRPVQAGDDPFAIWEELAGSAHGCWPIAPETAGELQYLVARLRERCHRIIAADAETLALCASKSRVAQVLAEARIPAVPTLRFDDMLPLADGPFIIKPDDGAGAVGVRRLSRFPSPPYPAGMILQRYIEGTPASLTLLRQGGHTHVLCANRQDIRVEGEHLHFDGVTVGGLELTDELRDLGYRVGAAIPGLHGICGLDYIATPHGPMVVEVNARLTTAYAGLRRALGVNPLAFIAEFIRDGVVPDLPHMPPALPVEIRL